MRSREEVIKRAILIKTNDNDFNIDLFTADDILKAANVSEKDINKIKESHNYDIDIFLKSLGN